MAVAAARISVAAALLTTLVASAACASSATGTAGTTGTDQASFGRVSGTLRETGGPPPGTDVAVAGTIYAYRSADLSGAPVASVPTDRAGHFAFKLQTGRYYLVGSSPRFSISPKPARPPCRAEYAVKIAAGRSAASTVICPMK